jgi:glycosyltransferase involved in cell wall biosynthesis
VVTSDAYACPEVAGDAAVLVNPINTEAITRSIRNMLTDRNLRKELREKGLRRAAQFSWEDSAERHYRAYHEVVEAASHSSPER